MSTMLRITSVSIVGLWITSVSISIYAHHGTAVSYDMTTTVTVSGIVTKFAFSNPHSQVYFDVTEEDGEVVRWASELNAPGVLSRGGWTRNTIKPGDQIEVTLNPSKAGTPVGNAVRSLPLIVNGNALPLGGRPIE